MSEIEVITNAPLCMKVRKIARDKERFNQDEKTTYIKVMKAT